MHLMYEKDGNTFRPVQLFKVSVTLIYYDPCSDTRMDLFCTVVLD